MEVFHSLEAAAAQRRPSTVTVGNFDGVHLGHRVLLARVQDCARQQQAVSVAVTFDPHPAAILRPERAPRVLTPLPLKLELLAQSGIEQVLVLPFTEELSHWTPDRFIEEVLVSALRARTVIVGENFRFGHKQSGTPQVLAERGRRWQVRTEVIPSLRSRGRVVSSSQIRALLADGNAPLANRLLGRPYSIRGPIRSGEGIGRTQTVPTFNLDDQQGMLPCEGVYVTTARLGTELAAFSAPHQSVTNIGRKPTFGEHAVGVETHLIETRGSSGDHAPPSMLDIAFLRRLRDERRFESPAELKAQILRDVQRARAYFRRLQRAGISLS